MIPNYSNCNIYKIQIWWRFALIFFLSFNSNL